MTITEANAANEVAGEVLKLAGSGVKITPDLEHGVGVLLINAHKALKAGHTLGDFLYDLGEYRRKAIGLHAPHSPFLTALCACGNGVETSCAFCSRCGAKLHWLPPLKIPKRIHA